MPEGPNGGTGRASFGWLTEQRRAGTSLAAGVVIGLALIVLLGLTESLAVPDAVVSVLFFYLLTYLVITATTFARASHPAVRAWAEQERHGSFWKRYVLGTEPGPGVSVFVASAALAVTTLWLPGLVDSGLNHDLRIAIAFAVVVVAWSCVLISFMVTFLADNLMLDEKGLSFPAPDGEAAPRQNRVDYFYFAVSVMTTFGTTDVDVTSSVLRRTVAVDGVIAFVFNTVIVATVVSALAS